MSQVRGRFVFLVGVVFCSTVAADEPPKPLRVGIIGLDTSHVTVFADLIHKAKPDSELEGVQIVAGYPGAPRIALAADRVKQYTDDYRGRGIETIDSIPALLTKVDAVLLESIDGHSHLEQVLPVLEAGKPVFIDKPLAGSLVDAIAIYELAQARHVPVFSSSSLRFYEGPVRARAGEFGDVLGCDTFGRCTREPWLPELYWYGIHGIEMLFACMGGGCESVSRIATDDFDLVAGQWRGGRIGSYRGLRKGKTEFGGTVFGTREIGSLGRKGGYEPLLLEIVRFFRTRRPPVGMEETIELFAFMEAADESKRLGGRPVSLESVVMRARAQVAARLAEVRAI